MLTGSIPCFLKDLTFLPVSFLLSAFRVSLVVMIVVFYPTMSVITRIHFLLVVFENPIPIIVSVPVLTVG